MSYIIKHLTLHPYLTGGPTQLGKEDGYLCGSDHFATVIDELITSCVNFGSDPFIVAMDISEGRLYHAGIESRLMQLRNILTEKLGNSYKFICDSSHTEHYEMYYDDIIYVNFINLVTYVYGCLDPNQKRNSYWNSNNKFGLFTPGKMDRYNRAMILRRLWENKSLKPKLVWSCDYSKNKINYIKNEFFADYSNEQFEKFMLETARLIDIKPISDDAGDFQYIGYPYDHTMYEKTLFSLIAESDFAGVLDSELKFIPKITEKTYRAISNKHPFILSWHQGFISMLENKGYKTFKEYLPIPEYNDIVDQSERLEATITNIEAFTSIAKNNIQAINNDVEYNYNLFVENAKIEASKLDTILNIDQTVIPDFNMNLQKFVTAAWPMCINFWAPIQKT